MNTTDRIAVCSRSFSRDLVLRKELLNKYLNVTFNDKGYSLKGEMLYEFLDGHDKAIVALERINDQLLQKLPQLKVISKYGVGLEMIEIDAMRRHEKRLGWKGGVNSRAVSELVISHAIALLRQVSVEHKSVLNGSWRQQYVGSQLTEKKVGIIGCGYVGKDLVQLLKPFGCEILAYDINEETDFYTKHNVQKVSLDDLLSLSDIITIHVPLNDTTINILDKERLSLMRSTSILINLSRGGLVDEVHLKKMLLQKRIAGAAFDVFKTEPPEDKELLELSNFIATPHISGTSEEAIHAMGRAAILGLDENSVP